MFTINENYKAFSKIIINDYPYKINHYFADKYVIKIFTQTFNDLLKQHSKIQDKYYSHQNKGILDLAFICDLYIRSKSTFEKISAFINMIFSVSILLIKAKEPAVPSGFSSSTYSITIPFELPSPSLFFIILPR